MKDTINFQVHNLSFQPFSLFFVLFFCVCAFIHFFSWVHKFEQWSYIFQIFFSHYIELYTSHFYMDLKPSNYAAEQETLEYLNKDQ